MDNITPEEENFPKSDLVKALPEEKSSQQKELEKKAAKAAHAQASRHLKYSLKQYLHELFGLHRDTDWTGTHDMVEKSIEFRGANLWTLIFAIFIASIGLNINSTAVIIGAMLISPLMGPIVGVGFGLATNDFPLFRLAIKNLFIATLISILASSLYFFLSPFKEATSEILSRTNPTAFDVFIAIIGGLTGIIATSRQERGNAVPGVAIATALMPPLCVTGYGLGTGQWNIAAGAFYLFLINSLFIAMASLTVVRYLNFPKKSFMDIKRGRMVKILLGTLMVAAVIPSTYTLINILKEGFVYRNINSFIDSEFQFPETAIISKKSTIADDQVTIEVTVYGKYLPEDSITKLKQQLPRYELNGAKLKILQQGKDTLDVAKTTEALRQEMAHLNQDLKVGILEDLYKKNEEVIQNKDAKIKILENEILEYKQMMNLDTNQMKTVLKETQLLFPALAGFAVDRSPKVIGHKKMKINQTPRLLLYWKSKKWLPKSQRDKLHLYLKTRLKLEDIEIQNIR